MKSIWLFTNYFSYDKDNTQQINESEGQGLKYFQKNDNVVFVLE
jgi:hypothetical protein